ncbi:MAG: hypothetical protein U5P10_08235 [Spirochaetia bacterium]|nr:hypothetical protein [Spirochaetia bacterium]
MLPRVRWNLNGPLAGERSGRICSVSPKIRGGLFRLTPKPIGPDKPDKRPEYRDQGFREKGLNSGAVYTYEVAAVDTSGNESPREAIEITIPDLEPPGRVFSFSVGPTREGGVRLRWQPTLSEDLNIQTTLDCGTGKRTTDYCRVGCGSTDILMKMLSGGSPTEYSIVEVDTSKNAGEASQKNA